MPSYDDPYGLRRVNRAATRATAGFDTAVRRAAGPFGSLADNYAEPKLLVGQDLGAAGYRGHAMRPDRDAVFRGPGGMVAAFQQPVHRPGVAAPPGAMELPVYRGSPGAASNFVPLAYDPGRANFRQSVIRNNAQRKLREGTFAALKAEGVDDATARRQAHVESQLGEARLLSPDVFPQQGAAPAAGGAGGKVATSGGSSKAAAVDPEAVANALSVLASGSEEAPGLMKPDEAMKYIDERFFPDRQQPPTQEIALPNQQAAGVPAAQVQARPVGTKRDIVITDEIAREMLRASGGGHLSSSTPVDATSFTTDFGNPAGSMIHTGTADPAVQRFKSTMAEYGVNGERLLGEWMEPGPGTDAARNRPGADGTFAGDVPRPDLGMQAAPAPRAQVRIPYGNGRGGVATLPGGESVVLSAGGRQVGQPIARGPAMPTPQAQPVMGPRRGFTPLGGQSMLRPTPAAVASEVLAKAGGDKERAKQMLVDRGYDPFRPAA